MTGVRATLSAMRELMFLILPRGCAGCDAPDEVLCPSCRTLFSQTMRRSVPGTADGRGYACARYRGVVRHAILSWKDHGDAECDEAFAVALADLLVRIGAVSAGEPVTLVPAPSSRSSMIRRGRWHMRDLAVRTARVLARREFAASVMPVLRTARVSSKSVEAANAAQRSARISGNIVVSDIPRCRGRRVVIVDDIMTTGATMRQCVLALTDAGARVDTVVALASVDK